MENKPLSWTFSNIWNQSLQSEPRVLEARNHIWASELGGAFVDRYLKMLATPETNPPNLRSHRKFQAGHIWEWIVELILKRAGLIIMKQERLTYQYEGLLEVSGKPDFLAGGKPDWAQAEHDIKELGFPEVIERASLNIINKLKDQIGDKHLKEIVLEVKSCSTIIFDRYERTGIASYHHTLQLFHYLKALNLDEGHIVYICRDDCRMLEIGVFNPSPVEEDYKRDIAQMTNFIKTGKMPFIEPEIIFDPTIGKIQKNWKVEYSNYLTKLYGYEEPEAYREMWDSRVKSFNGALGRLVKSKTGGTTPTGKPIVLTEKNVAALDELKAYFPDFDTLEQIAIEKLKAVDPDELEEV